MYRSIDVPWYYEGWDDIQVEYGEYENYFGWVWDWVEKADEYDQKNSHHTLTLGEHCRQTMHNVNKLYIEYRPILYTELRYAALLHDEGKIFTQTFKNVKGEVTEEAHYYSHEHCSSYDSLFYEIPCYNLYVAVLIRWHMTPYMAWRQSEKAKQRDKLLLGEELFNNIYLLHQADKEAH